MTRIIEVHHTTGRPGVPAWDGPLMDGALGMVYFGEGVSLQMTWEEYTAYLLRNFPDQVIERDPCPCCGK